MILAQEKAKISGLFHMNMANLLRSTPHLHHSRCLILQKTAKLFINGSIRGATCVFCFSEQQRRGWSRVSASTNAGNGEKLDVRSSLSQQFFLI